MQRNTFINLNVSGQKQNMTSLPDLITADLHLHILGAYTTKDFFDLGRDLYRDVDWNEEGFLDDYNRLYATTLDPVGIFDRARPEALEELRRAYVYSTEDGGDFARWEAKNSFFLKVWSHLRGLGRNEDLLNHMLHRHKDEGYRYIEYRCGSGMGGFMFWHALCAEVLQRANDETFSAKYIISIPRYAVDDAYQLTRDLMKERPDLVDTIVGIDFASVEEGNPPKHLAKLFRQLAADNKAQPEQALDAVYHVGESFFDKSIESAIRWCHEVAEMGVYRLGHAIALGLDPQVALARRPDAHEWETVEERLDQIAYDLKKADQLAEFGVQLDIADLNAEQRELLRLDPTDTVHRPYDETRIANILRRQDYVLTELVQWGTVIECCPTSNLRIGGIPHPRAHPLHRFLRSEVRLAICTDDPGGFETTMEQEVRWVMEHTGLDEKALVDRLGDPRRFRLGQKRVPQKTST